MPLNKLDNFIKNTEGRILYVSPSDLDSTDSIDNTGNSLARPFKTVQRALIEAARFSYIRGDNNDIIEKTTILLMPGEHIIDNRPGFKIKQNLSNQAKVISPSGAESFSTILNLDLNTNFDLNQEDNILYKFNSVYGGVIVPRGTSIVGLDLRKTKIRPLYVPNPTISEIDSSAIFRITGTCYFWQFTIFDGLESGTVYTDPQIFTEGSKSKPTFSHHKLTCFEYADGVNIVPNYDLTDLGMYYAKLSNAYGTGSGSPDRNIDSKYPTEPDGFAPQRPEYEIVGAFATDPIQITEIEAGSGGTPTNKVTVTTNIDHGFNEGTPIKINGASPADYNISTKVQSATVDGDTKKFTYLLPQFRSNLPTPGTATGATVTIETDTVSGASPYIFNCSLRSVWGMNGMHADGSKATGFKSMVVAQFTGISLQKDDRAFVKYNKSSRSYSGISITEDTQASLPANASSTNPSQVYHLDSEAIYRKGWEQTHIKITNDAILQIVSVFAIGFNQHFRCESGGDASITNSNSNFGQLSLVSDGFKKDAFEKDNKAFITNIITPRSIESEEESIDWLTIDVGVTTSVGDPTRLYLFGFSEEDNVPPNLTQGYRIGARTNDKLYVNVGTGATSEANILMQNGIDSGYREFNVSAVSSSKLTVGSGHGLQTGEKIILISDNADYPENIIPHITYYVIKLTGADANKIRLASTKTNAINSKHIVLYGGSNLRILSRVSDKISGDVGHPVQYDSNGWYIKVNSGNEIYNKLNTLGVIGVGAEETTPTFIKRAPDTRSIDEKIYKFRVVVPKELPNAKTPESQYIIQESSTTGARDIDDFINTTIGIDDYEYKKNHRFIAKCVHTSTTSTVTTELPHNLEEGDQIIIRNVTDSTNISGDFNSGYNGTFTIGPIVNNMQFTYENTQSPGASSTNDTNVRDENLPRFERSDLKNNFYIYRNEIINQYIDGQQDGIYHIYVLRSDASIEQEFTDLKYSQNVTDLYPQYDKDNINDSPPIAKTKAVSSPIGDVYTSDLKGSITRESADILINKLHQDLVVSSFDGSSIVTFDRDHTFNGIITGSITDPSGGRASDGDYYNVKLYDNNIYTLWRGATATVTLSGNTITSIKIQSPGSGYSNGDRLYFDNDQIGGAQDAYIDISTSGIINAIGDVVQVTGISSISDAYYRITNVPNETNIAIARTSGDPKIIPGSRVLHVGPSISVNSSTFTNGVTRFNCSGPHGLVSGNRFRVIDSSNNYDGDYQVKTKISVTSFEAETVEQISNPTYIFKHYFSANSGTSDSSDENLATRAPSFYDKDTLIISTGGSEIGITTTLIPVIHSSSGIGTEERFPLGSYIQVDNEIMRVSSSSLSGTNKLNVIRGVFSSEISTHDDGSLIRKIKPIPVEFRRPSIIRASGHTFEYLGYGPGNYSTALPQVQDRTLTEREEFLVQSQERSSGVVVYTGMNNRGDFYIGNTKKSSATGEETSFDTPIPTITGENPARLSAIFDEITVKERIVVEGGDSGQILSQFDGPVTFNNTVRIKDNASITGKLRIFSEQESTSTVTGALVVDGGVGIAKNLYVGGDLSADITSVGSLKVTDLTDNRVVIVGTDGELEDDPQLTFNGTTFTIGETTESTSVATGALVVGGGVGIDKDIYVGQNIYLTGDNDHLYIGASQDLDLYHDGTNSFINNNTGYLMIRNDSTNSSNVYIRAKGDENSIICAPNAGVTLYFDNVARLSTANDGVDITGNLRVDNSTLTTIDSTSIQITGDTSIDGALTVTGDITAFFTSDQRLKDNVTPIENSISKVLSISGNTFDWNEKSNKEGHDVGLIAQEILEVLPEAVVTRDTGYLAVDYHKVVPLLVEAIKELSGKVEALEQKLSNK